MWQRFSVRWDCSARGYRNHKEYLYTKEVSNIKTTSYRFRKTCLLTWFACSHFLNGRFKIKLLYRSNKYLIIFETVLKEHETEDGTSSGIIFILTQAPHRQQAKLYIRRKKLFSASKSSSKKRENKRSSWSSILFIVENKKVSYGDLQGKILISSALVWQLFFISKWNVGVNRFTW